VNATSPITAGNVETVRATVPTLGMDIHPVEVREPGDHCAPDQLAAH
jgi:hypothetical protein